jgi:uncharacterized protein
MSGFLFDRFFYALRAANLKIGLSEWMALLAAMEKGAIEPELTDFYAIARSLLVKNEADFDTYDQVFASVFGGARQMPAKALEELLEWLAEAKMLAELTPEMIAKLEALPLDELRRRFEERRREQNERHDGGNRWIGTGGTSPFGNSGMNPAGVRVGGAGGNRTAIQVATARRFKEYRNDRVLDTRSLAVALKKLRRLTRQGEPELDVEESIDKTCRNAGELSLEFRPPRQNEARVLLLMDVGGSMDPYTRLVEQLFSAASSLDHWRRFEAFTFHNCPYAKLEPASKKYGDRTISTAELMHDRPPETFLIMVGDAYMAPTELSEPFGAVEYDVMNGTPGIVWLHRLKHRFPRAVWLNPIPEKGWYGWTIKQIGRLFPMFSLTIGGLEDAVDCLLKRKPEPLPELADIFG